MTAKEWLESKSFAAAGKVNTQDALIALEWAELEGAKQVAEKLGNFAITEWATQLIAALKQKHNIQ